MGAESDRVHGRAHHRPGRRGRVRLALKAVRRRRRRRSAQGLLDDGARANPRASDSPSAPLRRPTSARSGKGRLRRAPTRAVEGGVFRLAIAFRTVGPPHPVEDDERDRGPACAPAQQQLAHADAAPTIAAKSAGLEAGATTSAVDVARSSLPAFTVHRATVRESESHGRLFAARSAESARGPAMHPGPAPGRRLFPSQ